MNLKNIIKLLIVFIPFFLLSCQKLDNSKNKDEKILLTAKDEIENLETFNNINLDPFSERYISKVVGDQKLEYNNVSNQMDVTGEYPNGSRYVRVRTVVAPTPQYFDQNGNPKTQFTGSIPIVQSGSFTGAVGQIVKISEGEKSIRTRTVSEIKTDPETNDIISIWNRDVDMNPDGHWKTYDIEYTPKFDVTNRFEPNERIYEAEEYERTAVGSARPSKYYRIKGEENTGLPIHLSRQALPKYGKVMGLSALAPNSVVPDFTSFTAGQMIPGWNDFFDNSYHSC